MLKYGELSNFIKDIDFSSKQELIGKLKAICKDVKNYPKEAIKPMRDLLNVALQQAYYASESDLLYYKKRQQKLNNKEK